MRDAPADTSGDAAGAVAALTGGGPEGPLFRLVAAHVAAEMAVQRGRAVDHAERRRWTAATAVDEDGLGFDSLGRLALVARLNRAFRLHRTGVEDYLLLRRTLGDWTGLVGEALRLSGEAATLVFETSGSTGPARFVPHALGALAGEAEQHAAVLPAATRVVTLVPAQHIFGCLFGVLGPALDGLPVVDLAGAGPGRTGSEIRPGDRVIATPHLWSVLLAAGAVFPGRVTGVVSTAPCPAPLWDRLAGAGLSGLSEVYGATETAGLGWRTTPGAPFALLPHLLRTAEGIAAADGRRLDPVDRLDWVDDRRFRVLGRLDGGVQVGGVNVFPTRVAACLAAVEGVADAAVRLDGSGADARLKAFLALEPGADPLAVEAAARARAAADLSSPERPQRFATGTALPRDGVGKLCDWA